MWISISCFYQTISCGALLIKNKANFNTLLHHADYLNREGDELPNLVDKSIATTKRFDALKMFMTLKAVGEKQLGEFYDYLLELTQQVAIKFKPINILNYVVLRFYQPCYFVYRLTYKVN